MGYKLKKALGPNPLSVKRKQDEDEGEPNKRRRKRKGKRSKELSRLKKLQQTEVGINEIKE